MTENAIIAIDPTQAIQNAKKLVDIVRVMRTDVLRENVDYGIIPGTNKPSLLKPGAERLCAALGLDPKFDFLDKVENWSPEAPLFNYTVICRLIHIESGLELATGIGSCNSMESKYRWRWLWPNQLEENGISPDGLLVKTTKKGGKQYRAPNDDIYSYVNTIQKMACKRALIAAVLIGANASEFFTQDVEDLRDFGSVDVVEGEIVDEQPAAPKKQQPAPQPEVNPLEALRARVHKELSPELTDEQIAKYGGIDAFENVGAWRDKFGGLDKAFKAVADNYHFDQIVPEPEPVADF